MLLLYERPIERGRRQREGVFWGIDRCTYAPHTHTRTYTHTRTHTHTHTHSLTGYVVISRSSTCIAEVVFLPYDVSSTDLVASLVSEQGDVTRDEMPREQIGDSPCPVTQVHLLT